MGHLNPRQHVFILCGPTCSGKTSLALNLCRHFGGEIISADSRQVCKYMDIGTGKIVLETAGDTQKLAGRWVVSGINIWGYDLVTPDTFFSGYDFAKYALSKAKALLQEQKSVVIVGGTGFYIDLITGAIQPAAVEPNLELRNHLETLSLEELNPKLMSLNLQEHKRLDTKNKVRLIRAIEKALSEKKNTTPLPYLTDVSYHHLGLTAPRAMLYQRADRWLEHIWAPGLLDEVRSLIKLGYEHSPKMQGLIYKSVLAYLNGSMADTEAIQKAKYDLHAYIRRQQTWFKRNKNITWFDITKADFAESVYNWYDLVNG